jgi:hypothetical protein
LYQIRVSEGIPNAWFGTIKIRKTPPFLAVTNVKSWTDAPPAGELWRYYRARKQP